MPHLGVDFLSQIFCASRADLQMGPSPPVIAMLNPIREGPSAQRQVHWTEAAAAAPPRSRANLAVQLIHQRPVPPVGMLGQ